MFIGHTWLRVQQGHLCALSGVTGTLLHTQCDMQPLGAHPDPAEVVAGPHGLA